MSSISDLVSQVIAEHGDGLDIELEWNPLPAPQQYMQGYADKFLYIPPATPTLKKIKVRWVNNAL